MPKEKVMQYWDRDTDTKKQVLGAVAGAHSRSPANCRLVLNLQIFTEDPTLTLLEIFNENHGSFFSHPENPTVRVCTFKIERITDQNRNDISVFGDGRDCVQCGYRFQTKHKRAMYCSNTCKQKAYYERIKEKESGGDKNIDQ